MSKTFMTPRAAILAVYAGYGACMGSWAGSIPTVTTAAGISSNGLGLGLTAFTVAYVIAMAQGSKLAIRLSSRRALTGILPVIGLTTLWLLVSANPSSFFLALVVWGATLGILDLFMNAEASAIEHDVGRPIFTTFHGAASIGMPVFAILSSFVSTEIGTWLTALIALLPMGLAWFLVKENTPARALPVRRAQGAGGIVNRLPLVLMGVASGFIIASETAAVMWSARLLEEQAPDLAAVAGAGAAFFGTCNAILRFPGDTLRRLFGDIPLLMGSLVVAIAGFALLGISNGFAMSIAAFALVGLGTAVLIPCLFALAASYVPANRAAGIGFVSLVAGVPRTLAPWIFGWIASGFSTSFAFGLCAILLTVALTMIVLLRSLNERLQFA